MPFHIYFYHWCQILSFLIAVCCYKGLRLYKIEAFIPLLLVTCVIELLGSNSKYFGWGSNYFIYNMYLLLSPPFYLWLFYRMLHLSGKASYIYFFIAVLCILLILVNYYFLQGTNKFNSDSFLFIEFINIVFCSMVLFKMAVIDEPENERIYMHPFFWISVSLLLFSLGSLVVLGLQEYIVSHQIQMEGKSIYRIIMPVLNVILYLGYTYAFLLCRKKIKKSLLL